MGEGETGKKETGRRWHDSSKVIWALFSVIGVILGGWGATIATFAKEKIATVEKKTEENRTSLETLKTTMELQVKEINRDLNEQGKRLTEALNVHLREPGIHQGGIDRVTDALSAIKNATDQIRGEQSTMLRVIYTNQTDIQAIKKTVEDIKKKP